MLIVFVRANLNSEYKKGRYVNVVVKLGFGVGTRQPGFFIVRSLNFQIESGL